MLKMYYTLKSNRFKNTLFDVRIMGHKTVYNLVSLHVDCKSEGNIDGSKKGEVGDIQ